MDDVRAERTGLARKQGVGARGLDAAAAILGQTTPEDVVLPTGVHADHRPHTVTVRPGDGVRMPDEVDDGEARRATEDVKARALRLAECGQRLVGIGDGASD